MCRLIANCDSMDSEGSENDVSAIDLLKAVFLFRCSMAQAVRNGRQQGGLEDMIYGRECVKACVGVRRLQVL